MQPVLLPLLPAPPILLSAKQPTPRVEPTFEEKRKAWAERVQLLSNSLQQRSNLAKIDQEINLIRRLSLHVQTSNESDRSKESSEAKLAALTSRREAAKADYDSILNRIIAIDNWPVLPSIDTEDREFLNKMVKYCEDLQRSAEEINHVLSRSISILPSNDVPMGDGTRPLKRRRVEDGKQDGEQAAENVTEIHEELRDRVLALHGTMTTLQNDQTAIRNDLMMEYKAYADTQFDEATVDMTKRVQLVEDKAKGIEDSINSTGDDVGELAGDIEQLILDNDAFKAEIAETNNRIKDTQAKVAELEQRIERVTQERSHFVKAVEALKVAHDAYLARPKSPPVSPSLPHTDLIIQSVQDPLIEAVRSAIKPMLISTRENIQALLQERNAEIYETLWRRLSLTLKLVDVLSARLASLQGATGASR